MKLPGLLGKLFGSNKQNIQLDEFAQAKLDLGKDIFVKWQQAILDYAAETKKLGVPEAGYAESLPAVLDLLRLHLNGMSEAERITTEHVNAYKNKYDKDILPVKERNFNQYHAPLINYYKQEVQPWMESYIAENSFKKKGPEYIYGASWDEIGSQAPIDTLIEPDDLSLLQWKSQKQLANYRYAYWQLIFVTPENGFDKEYLLQAKEMLDKGEIEAMTELLEGASGSDMFKGLGFEDDWRGPRLKL